MVDCPVCDKIREKKARIVYEDDSLIAVLPSKPAVPSHIRIMPKIHVTKLDELSPEIVQDLFFLSNFASSAAFDTLKAHGTNIILTESDDHLAVDVIPRKESDGINFLWKPKQLAPEEMGSVAELIKDKAFIIGKSEEPKKEPVVLDRNPKQPSEQQPANQVEKPTAPAEKPQENHNGKNNYLLRNLERIP